MLEPIGRRDPVAQLVGECAARDGLNDVAQQVVVRVRVGVALPRSEPSGADGAQDVVGAEPIVRVAAKESLQGPVQVGDATRVGQQLAHGDAARHADIRQVPVDRGVQLDAALIHEREDDRGGERLRDAADGEGVVLGNRPAVLMDAGGIGPGPTVVGDDRDAQAGDLDPATGANHGRVQGGRDNGVDAGCLQRRRRCRGHGEADGEGQAKGQKEECADAHGQGKTREGHGRQMLRCCV